MELAYTVHSIVIIFCCCTSIDNQWIKGYTFQFFLYKLKFMLDGSYLTPKRIKKVILKCIDTGLPLKVWKKGSWLCLTWLWTQNPLTIFVILREVLLGAWNDNCDIFQMKIITFLKLTIMSCFFKRSLPFPDFLQKQKNTHWLFLSTLFFQVFRDFQGQWECCDIFSAQHYQMCYLFFHITYML